MSYALITNDLGGGRYTIQLDWGQAQKDALLSVLAQKIAKIDAKLVEANDGLAEAEERERNLRESIAQEIDEIIALQEMDPQLVGLAIKAHEEAFGGFLKQYNDLLAKHAPLRQSIATLKLMRAESVRSLAQWSAFLAIETRDAWCTTYTEGRTGQVATIEVNGESNHILIAPNGRPWTPGDGVLAARELMSPEQAFFNAALLPGWQKHMPTYRWGTVTAINESVNTMDLALAPAASSAQKLGINQQPSLANVPVTYLNCDCLAFEVGDRAIVKFDGQNQNTPRVIGFLDNPRECIDWPPVTINMWYRTEYEPSLGTKLWCWASLGPCGLYIRKAFINVGAEPVEHPIARAATSSIVVEEPVFTDTVHNEKLTILTENGIFNTPLWSASSSAMGFRISPENYGNDERGQVPAGAKCDAHYVDHSSTLEVIVRRFSRTDHVQSLLTYQQVIPGANDPCEFPIHPTETGAWDMERSVPGFVIIEDAIREPADEFLISRGAMPTISVSRRGGGRQSAYDLTGIENVAEFRSETEACWRFTFERRV